MKSIIVSNNATPGRVVEPSRHFDSARDAKEFLIEWIVAEARKHGVNLSDVERKMLYLSSNGWTLPDIAEVHDAFDRYHEPVEYELKMANLIRLAHMDIVAQGPAELETWNQAVRILKNEDHYVLQLIEAAQGPRRRRTNHWKMWILTILLLAAALVVGYMAARR